MAFMDSIIAAIAGLAGVLIGAWMTSRSQKQERRQAFLRRQLDEFYSPMVGMRARILAKSASRVKVEEAAGSAWVKLVTGKEPEAQIELEKRHSDDFKVIIDDNNRQLAEELLPLYRQMLDCFSAHFGLAELETRRYYGAFVHFVDVWDRHERKALPAVVTKELHHREGELEPFYQDLLTHMGALQKELKKG